MDTVARGEMAESSIDAFISKRDKERRQTEGERAREELWKESVRAHNARCGDEQRLARLRYHEGQAIRLGRTLGALIRFNRAEAERYRNGHEGEGGR
jgi:hypothetical protein